jgi:hypothetical protein
MVYQSARCAVTVYFIEMEQTGFIKIGYTATYPGRRMAQLQTGQPYKLKLLGCIAGEKKDEKSLHKELSRFRGNGEWFVPSVRSIVEHLIKAQGPWFLCREPEFLRKQIEDEWRVLFSREVDDDCQIYGSEKDLHSAHRKILGFCKQAARFHLRYGFYPYRNLIRHREAADLFKIIDGIGASVYRAASYIAVWEGVKVPSQA